MKGQRRVFIAHLITMEVKNYSKWPSKSNAHDLQGTVFHGVLSPLEVQILNGDSFSNWEKSSCLWGLPLVGKKRKQWSQHICVLTSCMNFKTSFSRLVSSVKWGNEMPTLTQKSKQEPTRPNVNKSWTHQWVIVLKAHYVLNYSSVKSRTWIILPILQVRVKAQGRALSSGIQVLGPQN